MGVLTVTTPFNIDLEFRIAALHKRILAWLIDIVIIYAFVYVMFFFLVTQLHLSEYVDTGVMYLLVLLPAYTYHLVLEIALNGRSVGKIALGIKVMDISGNEATISQYLLRWLLRIVDMGVTSGVAAIISAAVTTNTQRLGDLAAGTIVIDNRYKTSLHDTIYLDIEEADYIPVFPEVMRLTDRDINGIRNLLDVKNTGHDTNIYMAQVVYRIKEVLAIQSDLGSREFLTQLLADYNFLTRK